MFFATKMKLRAALLAMFLLGLWAAPVFSQGCAMCASYTESSSKEGQKAINKGVLLLLLPPAGFMTVGIAMAYRYGRKRDLEQR